MQKKYIIIAEYKHVAPFISRAQYDTVEEAKQRVVELDFEDNRVWISPIIIYRNGNWSQESRGQIKVQDFNA